MRLALLLFTFLAASVCAAEPAALRSALLFHAAFDGRADADFAAGDARIYHAPTGDRTQAKVGLPEDGLVRIAAGAGRHGDALHFTQKIRPVIFFRGERNLPYRTNAWGGAVSVWLRLDPDRDLAPGYCDPLQFVGQQWEVGNLFIEFSKDHTPRHFRAAILPVKKSWNPANREWEAIPEKERPMVPVHRPPFTRERWTHVVVCFDNVNSGRADGWGRLYLDGQDMGAFENWALPFNWQVERSALTLGYSYTGWLDDVAVFHRPLTPDEVRALHALPGGVKGLSITTR
jgi:hypothetical protein